VRVQSEEDRIQLAASVISAEKRARSAVMIPPAVRVQSAVRVQPAVRVQLEDTAKREVEKREEVRVENICI
jgi:hypothetical protein